MTSAHTSGLLDVVVNPDDVRMVERGEQPRLGREAIAGARVAQERGRQSLDGHVAPEPDVPRGEHDGEGTTTQHRTEHVAGKGTGELGPLVSRHQRWVARHPSGDRRTTTGLLANRAPGRWRSTALVTMLLVASTAPTAVAAVPDQIRVGGPSAPAESKVAVVGSEASLVGARFTVRSRRGDAVLTGSLEPAAGAPSPWPHAARADLSGVTTPGTYVIGVGGLRSPPWIVDASAERRLLRDLLRVFAVNADGREPNPVFGPAHLADAAAPIVGGPSDGGRVDVEGGWRDAGDAIKFTTTTAIASALLDLSALLVPEEAGRLRTASDIGVRWLRKAHPAGSPPSSPRSATRRTTSASATSPPTTPRPTLLSPRARRTGTRAAARWGRAPRPSPSAHCAPASPKPKPMRCARSRASGTPGARRSRLTGRRWASSASPAIPAWASTPTGRGSWRSRR